MKNQKRFKNLALFINSLVVILLLSWPVNLYRLTQCDFKSDYRCEVIHAVGLIPMAAPFTVWFGVDE
jgi:hypothetical protein